MYVIITMGGVGVLGPFPSEQDAIDYAKKIFHSIKWFVRPIFPVGE